MRRRLAGVLALVALTLAESCRDASAPPAAIAGIYELQSVDGDPLPVVLFDDVDGREEMLGGHVDLFSNGTFSDVTAIRTTVNGSTTEEDVVAEGAYQLNGTTVSFIHPDGSYTMELEGTSLIQDWNGFILVYKKIT